MPDAPVVKTNRFEYDCNHVHKAVTWLQARFNTKEEIKHTHFYIRNAHGGDWGRVQSCARSFFGATAYLGHPGNGVFLDAVFFTVKTSAYGTRVDSYIYFVREANGVNQDNQSDDASEVG